VKDKKKASTKYLSVIDAKFLFNHSAFHPSLTSPAPSTKTGSLRPDDKIWAISYEETHFKAISIFDRSLPCAGAA
jgi:hypothetical protein